MTDNRSLSTTIVLPFQETLTTYFAIEELKCYTIVGQPISSTQHPSTLASDQEALEAIVF